MKKKKRTQIKIRKPVAKKPTEIIVSKKERLKRKRVKSKELMKRLYDSFQGKS
jgi:hypothetical protein